MKVLSLAMVVAAVMLAGCAPEIGSEPWCQQLKEKPKGDWTGTEVKDYAKYCLF